MAFFLYLVLLATEYLGLTNAIPILQLMRFSTLLAWGLFAYTASRVGARAFGELKQNRLLLAFVGFTGLSLLYAVVTMQAFTAFRGHFDYFGLFVTTLYLVDRPARIRKVAIVASIVLVVAVARNLDKLTASTRVSGFEGAYFMGDGNDFAWAMNVLMPLALLLVITKGKLTRLIGAAGVLAGLIAVVGTQSRGAVLALGASLGFYWLFVAKRKAFGVAVMSLGVVALLALAPSAFFERMQSLDNLQEDNSAQGRLQAWSAALRMAIDFPLGVGANNFSPAYGLYYMPSESQSNMTWGARRWLSAHSVYFRALGEYGILGVVWLISILIVNFRDNLSSWRVLRAGRSPDDMPVMWPMLLNMSLIGYAISGLFLGGLMYPHLYVISALTASTVRRTAAARSEAPAVAPDAARSIAQAPLTKVELARRAISGTALVGVRRQLTQ